MASELSKIVRKGVDKAYDEFTDKIIKLDFSRNKKTTWARLNKNTADVILLSRSGASYGTPYNASVTININLHCCPVNFHMSFI